MKAEGGRMKHEDKCFQQSVARFISSFILHPSSFSSASGRAHD
jgi:hypothetical protein